MFLLKGLNKIVKRFLLILLIALPICKGYAQIHEQWSSSEIALFEMEKHRQKSNFVENSSYSDYDLIYQRMNWDIDPEQRYIQGEITSYIKSELDGLAEIEFDLYDGLVVDSIIQQNQHVNFSHSSDKIRIQLKSELQKGRIDSLKIYYQGEPAEGGFGSFEKSVHNNVPIVWTLSEPYGAKDWWPCKQSLIDKIDSIDIIVKTPEEYRAASNGILVSDLVLNGYRTMHWKHRFPITTYLVAIAVTNYVYYSDYLDLENGDSIEILNYVYPESFENAKNNTQVTIPIMKLFNEIVGLYPFAKEKYGHAQFGRGGGMEHQTMSFMGSFNFGLIAHELAHQWFGDYITLSSWQDIWLNEGFATYMAALAIENLQSEQDWLNWKRESIDKITKNQGGSVFVVDTTSVSRVFDSRLSYTKGAYLLHMLRWILGDDAFFEGIRNYYNDPEVANGFANNQQFIKHMEAAGDTSLTEFFNDWYYGEGYPTYSLDYVKTDNGKILIELTQKSSHNSVDFFEMPVPVRLYNAGETDSVSFRLSNTQNNQKFLLDVDFEVSSVVIDPDMWLISKTTSNLKVLSDDLSNSIKIYPNPTNHSIQIFVASNIIIYELSLYSIKGELIKTFTENTREIDLSGQGSGIYLFNIKTNKGIFSRKVSKK